MKPAYLVLALALGLLAILALTYREDLVRQCQQVWPALCGAQEEAAAPPPVEAIGEALEPALAEPPSRSDDWVPPTPPAGPDAAEPIAPAPAYVADDATLQVELARFDPPSSWFELDDLRQRLATLLVSLADGFLPRQLLGPIRPAAEPSAVPQSGPASDPKFRLVENGTERFGPVVDVALRLPPAAAAQLLERLEPALNAELEQLGDRRDLDALLNGILDQLEAVPVLEEAPLVRRPGLRYVYVDPALESLNDLRKTALRMGPELRERVVAYGRAVLAERVRLNGAGPTPD